MNSLIINLAIFAAIIFISASNIFAAALDDYYLERFGELQGHSSSVSGVSQVTREPLLDRCYTPVYHALRHDWPKLAAGTQQVLAKYLAKPVLENEAFYDSPGGHFRIHFATSGIDAPPPADTSPANGIPDWVETTASVFETVYTKEVGELLYASAPTISGQPYDVYLQNLGGGIVKYLGLTNSSTPLNSISYTSYITIDNDFSEFSTNYTPLEYLQTTAAHEYHHAIQYGYNIYFDIWYAEATSTWIEDEVFDSVNQIYDYLPAWFLNMDLPLNAPVDSNAVNTGAGYGRWLFNRYIAETVDRDIVRTIWTRLAQRGATADKSDIPMIPILDEVLGGIGDSLLGFGKRIALKDWSSHQGDIPLIYIHPLPSQNGTSPLPLSAFPGQPYSLAFFSFPLNSVSSVDLSNKPTAILSGSVSTSQSDILVLCNSGTAVTPGPANKSSSGGGSGCFIATAAYGSYLHPKVMVLRGFRDRWLLSNPVGRMIVSCYYRISPSMAAVISRHEWMRRGCRAMLSPLIATIEHPESIASLVMGLLGWILIRRRVKV